MSISNCNGEYILQLEREDNAWKNAWSRAIPACASPPIVISAHSVRPDSIHLLGAYGTNIMPSFTNRNMQSVFRLRIYDLKLVSNPFVLDDPRY